MTETEIIQSIRRHMHGLWRHESEGGKVLELHINHAGRNITVTAREEGPIPEGSFTSGTFFIGRHLCFYSPRDYSIDFADEHHLTFGKHKNPEVAGDYEWKLTFKRIGV
jgi:hypothetical protein